jgi:nucleoside-diphosphate-sugar epimerase
MKERILIIGGLGYIGSRLCPFLIENNFDVEILDTLWFGNQISSDIKLFESDALSVSEEFLANYDQVIFLAGMSNDPMADFSPRLNFISNLATPAYVGLLCRRAGVKRFVFASSCSVYGFSPERVMTELDKARTDTPYGLSKLSTETALMNLVNDDFSVICLRKGTVSGASPRLRFDLLLNTMFKTAMTQHKIIVNNRETWRPLLGISDAINAYLMTLIADKSKSGIFNVCSSNFQIGDLAEITRVFLESSMSLKVEIDYRKSEEFRSYRVDSSSAMTNLKFEPKDTPESILNELKHAVSEVKDFDLENYYNIKVFEKLGLR